jgi:hypothetical protein
MLGQCSLPATGLRARKARLARSGLGPMILDSQRSSAVAALIEALQAHGEFRRGAAHLISHGAGVDGEMSLVRFEGRPSDPACEPEWSLIMTCHSV